MKRSWSKLAAILFVGILFSVAYNATSRARLREPAEPDLRIVVPEWFLVALPIAVVVFVIWFWRRRP